MTKIRNQRIWSNDQSYLERLAEEMEFIGRPYKLEAGLFTVFALPPRRQKKKNEKSKEARNKRAESAARRG